MTYDHLFTEFIQSNIPQYTTKISNVKNMAQCYRLSVLTILPKIPERTNLKESKQNNGTSPRCACGPSSLTRELPQ